MLKGIDISNWQKGFSLSATKPGFVIVKATEGLTFVDKCCDGFVQDAIKLGIPWGFYHFARSNDAAKEATYFYNQTKNYVGKGIPVLDFEVLNSNSWLETWCKTYHRLAGVYPWVYMSSDYINNRGYGTDWVKSHCGLWLAGYPKAYTSYPSDSACPYKHAGWTLAAWQFTSSLSMGGMRIDGNFFYGDATAWAKYAGSGNGASGSASSGSDSDNGDTHGTAIHALGPLEVWQYARRVIAGEFGNGTARKNALGSNYDTVQSAVNMLVNGTDKALAQIVLTGAMGNGTTRKNILGSRYSAVQAKVNKLVK